MEVPSQIDNLDYVVVWVLLVGAHFYTFQQVQEVLISDWELFEKTVQLKQFEAEMRHAILLKDLTVGMSFEIPLIEVIHHLQDVRPKPGVHIKNLLNSFFFFLDLILVKFLILSMQLF